MMLINAKSDLRSCSVRYCLWFVFLFLVTQVPLFVVRYPDIADFPNHLARLHIQVHLEGSELLRRFYVERLGLAPNLVLDVLGPPLGRLFGLEHGLKTFALIGTLLLSTGALALGVALTGRLTFLGLGCLLFAQNAFAHLGNFNFLFGIGLALWLLAAWIFLRNRGLMSMAWLMAFAAAAALLYLCHLSAIGFYFLGVLGYELSISGKSTFVQKLLTSAGLALFQTLPAIVIHLFVYQPGTSQPMLYPSLPILVLALHKAKSVAMIPYFCFHTYPVLTGITTGVVLTAMHRAWSLDVLSFSRVGMYIAGLLGVALLLAPPFGFGSNMVDVRIVLPLVLVLWASLWPTTITACASSSWLLSLSIVMGVVLTSVGTLHRWSKAEDMHSELRTAMLAIQEGSKVAVVSLDDAWEPPAPHMAAWSVIDRSVFLSSLFVRPVFPFATGYRPELVSLARLARLDADAPPPDLKALRGGYDYVVLFGGPTDIERYLAGAPVLYRASRTALLSLH